jgi:hypothetical protein
MKQTIPRRLPESHPRGDHRARCAYCGVVWMRSKLRLDGAGNLVCPDEGEGRDAVTLSRLNADAARQASKNFAKKDRHKGGGGGDTRNLTPQVRTTHADIYNLGKP